MNSDRRQFLDDAFTSFSMLAQHNFVAVHDVMSGLSRFSPGAVEMFHLPGEYVPDGPRSWEEHVHHEDQSRYRKVMMDLLTGRTSTYDLTYRCRIRDGSYSLFRFRGSVIRDRDGRPGLVGGVIINEGRLELTDSTTMLRNQDGFFIDLAALKASERHCVILLIGINELPRINRDYNYSYGNLALQQVAWLLQEEAGSEAVVYRMEGTRFAIISRSLSEEKMDKLYQRISRKLHIGVPIKDEGRQPLSVSGGLLVVNDFARSERALYDCLKSVYKNSKYLQNGMLVAFNSSNNEATRSTLSVIDRIRSCMIDEFQNFFLEYQPVVHPKTGKILGVEALLRWKDETVGFVSTNTYISVLSQDFAFEDLGLWILRQTMQETLPIITEHPNLLIGVNISAGQIRDAYFPGNVIDILHQTGFPPANLCLELSLECRRIPLEILQARIANFRQHGIRIIIDDFGSGFSSLECLQELSADLVKIDMRYVEKIESSPCARNDLKSLCSMASCHRTLVCVKGVEASSVLEILASMPIDCIQGFAIARPMSRDALAHWVS